MAIIGFLGRKGHGKDTASDYLVDNYGYVKIALATPLKEACRILFDFDEEQLYGNKKENIDPNWNVSPRTVYQYLGTDIFRRDINKIIPDIKDNFWAKRLENKICQIMSEAYGTDIVISDVRFQNEVDVIHGFGGTVIKIFRPNIENESNHISECGIERIKLKTKTIMNDGTKDDLYHKLDILMDDVNMDKILMKYM